MTRRKETADLRERMWIDCLLSPWSCICPLNSAAESSFFSLFLHQYQKAMRVDTPQMKDFGTGIREEKMPRLRGVEALTLFFNRVGGGFVGKDGVQGELFDLSVTRPSWTRSFRPRKSVVSLLSKLLIFKAVAILWPFH